MPPPLLAFRRAARASVVALAAATAALLLARTAAAQPATAPGSTGAGTTTTTTSTTTTTTAATSTRRSDSASAANGPRLPASALRGQVRAGNNGLLLQFGIPGEWQVRGVVVSDIPLAVRPGATGPGTLGQNTYLENWFRFRPYFAVGDNFRVVGQFDVARGIFFGDSTRQVELSRDSRSTLLSLFPRGPFDFRWLYIDWTSPIGVFRVGQQGNHWGLGILANDGDHPPVFGDYRIGDIVERVAFATRPFGRNTDLVAALGVDMVYRDRITSLLEYQVPVEVNDSPRNPTTRTLGGDLAFGGVLSVFYQHHACRTDCDRKRVGLFAVFRNSTNRLGDYLRVFAADVYARWEWPTPDGAARVFAATELALVLGETTITRTATFPTQGIVQYGGVVELGVERDRRFRLAFDAGYASGDANPVDGVQRRFTFSPDYRVGLILFPELINWQTARSASIASSPELAARAARGAELLPSSGGVTNAMYINPTAIVNVARWLDLRAGLVAAGSATDVVDPVQVQLYGAARNYRGGPSNARDLGLELDAAVMARQEIGLGLVVTGGVQGGVAFPGHAFDDAAGQPMPPVGIVIGRAGLVY